MSEEGNAANESKNSIPLAQQPKDFTTLINVSERTEPGPSSGEPIATERDVFNRPESTRVRKLCAKWEDVGKKTYAEIASQLPGGYPEGYGNPSQVHSTTHILYQQQQGPSNQDVLCQESHPPVQVEHAPQEQHLQGSHAEESALQGHFSKVCQLLLYCDIKLSQCFLKT